MRLNNRATRILFALVCFCSYALTPERAAAQEEAEHVRLARESYIEATAMERDGFENPRGGAGSQYLAMHQTNCLSSALSSYRLSPRKLTAWRIVSCAAGTERWLLAYLAVEAFRRLEPLGIEGYRHDDFSAEEIARVRQAAHEARRHVGAIRWNVPRTRETSWIPELEPGALPESSSIYATDPVFTDGPILVDGVLYLRAGVPFSATIVRGDTIQRIEMTAGSLLFDAPQDLPEPPPASPPAPPPAPPTPAVESAQTPQPETPVVQTISVAPILSVPPVPENALSSDSSPARRSLAAPIVVLSTGLAAAGAGGVFWFLSDGIRTDLDAVCPSRRSCPADLRADADRGSSYVVAGNVLVIGGSAVAAAGLVWTIVNAVHNGGIDDAQSAVSPFGVAPIAGGALMTFGGSL